MRSVRRRRYIPKRRVAQAYPGKNNNQSMQRTPTGFNNRWCPAFTRGRCWCTAFTRGAWLFGSSDPHAPHGGSKAMYPCLSVASVSNLNRHSVNHDWRLKPGHQRWCTAFTRGACEFGDSDPHAPLGLRIAAQRRCIRACPQHPCPTRIDTRLNMLGDSDRMLRWAAHSGSKAMCPCLSVASVSDLNRHSVNHAWRLKPGHQRWCAAFRREAWGFGGSDPHAALGLRIAAQGRCIRACP